MEVHANLEIKTKSSNYWKNPSPQSEHFEKTSEHKLIRETLFRRDFLNKIIETWNFLLKKKDRKKDKEEKTR